MCDADFHRSHQRPGKSLRQGSDSVSDFTFSPLQKQQQTVPWRLFLLQQHRDVCELELGLRTA